MFLILAFAIAFGTAIVWSRIFLRTDKFDPEPRRLFVSLFLAGCIVTIPSAFVERLIPANDLTWAAVVAPSVEEGFKFAAVGLICLPNRHFNQIIDGALYGVSCALGFAAVENLLFGLSGGFGLLGLRALLGPIDHPFFTGVAGYYLARGKFEGNRWLVCQGILFATLLHSGWNLGPGLIRETGNPVYGLVFLSVIPVYAWLLWRFLRQLGTPEAQRFRLSPARGAASTSLGPGTPSASNAAVDSYERRDE